MEVRQPRVVEALARVVYPLEEPQLAAITPSHVRRAQLVRSCKQSARRLGFSPGFFYPGSPVTSQLTLHVLH